MRAALPLTVTGFVAAALLGGVASAATASADERHCYGFHANLPVVGQHDTTEQCVFLPVDPGLG